jgi:hypothetical protein
MYNEYVAGGRKGKPVAPPGTSKHETGNAVDINQADADAMARMGILEKYGLNRPVANDPVHIELAKTSGPNGKYKSKNRPQWRVLCNMARHHDYDCLFRIHWLSSIVPGTPRHYGELEQHSL